MQMCCSVPLLAARNFIHCSFRSIRCIFPILLFWSLKNTESVILKKTKLREEEFQEFVLQLFSNVTVVPNLLLSETSLDQAYQLCREIDEKDTVYVAAAIELDLVLVTNDRVLYSGLRERNFSGIALLNDVVDTLPRMP